MPCRHAVVVNTFTPHLPNPSDVMSAPMSRKKKARRVSKPGVAHFVPLPARQVVATDWSITAQSLPHMNDPHMDNKVYNFMETVTYESYATTSTSVATFNNLTFALANCPNVASYIAIFDQYRITQVEVWTIPQGTTSNALWKTVVDYDNATNLGSIASADAYQNVHTTNFQGGQYRRFTPHAAMAVYAGAFTSFGNIIAPWVDAANTGVLHYGMKYYFDPTPSAALTVDIVVRYWLQFRNRY